jgi:HAD superfamily hydrolase (TIGR01509 family)
MIAVIFDFDGTILDTETPAFQSHCRLFREHGAELSADEWCQGIGTIQPETYWFDRLCERAAAPPTYEEFRRAARAYYRECVTLEPMPGILPLLDELAQAGVPRGVGSNAPAEWVLGSLREIGLADRFGAVVTSDQVERAKPAPDVYLEAARRLRRHPGRCVVIEDSETGLASARSAGMPAVAIHHALNRSHDLSGAALHASTAEELTLDRLKALLDVRSG